jgi:hypothetical protein
VNCPVEALGDVVDFQVKLVAEDVLGDHLEEPDGGQERKHDTQYQLGCKGQHVVVFCVISCGV